MAERLEFILEDDLDDEAISFARTYSSFDFVVIWLKLPPSFALLRSAISLPSFLSIWAIEFKFFGRLEIEVVSEAVPGSSSVMKNLCHFQKLSQQSFGR